jgi:hypothetical protein
VQGGIGDGGEEPPTRSRVGEPVWRTCGGGYGGGRAMWKSRAGFLPHRRSVVARSLTVGPCL